MVAMVALLSLMGVCAAIGCSARDAATSANPPHLQAFGDVDVHTFAANNNTRALIVTSGPACGNAWTTQAFEAHNRLRVAAGVKRLLCDTRANGISAAWAKTLCTRHIFTHDGFSSRCSRAGYGNCGENILYNYADGSNAGDVATTQWRNSPPHYKNIVNRVFTVMGIGYYRCTGGRVYWSALFGK